MMTPPNPNFPGESTNSSRVERQYDSTTPPSIAIVKAISEIEDVDPVDSTTALGLCLHDHVNPEALDRLVTEGKDGTPLTIGLTLHNSHRYVVRIEGSGNLTVKKSPDPEGIRL